MKVNSIDVVNVERQVALDALKSTGSTISLVSEVCTKHSHSSEVVGTGENV